MLKVILPNKNDWLNCYFNTKEAYEKKDISKIKKHELDKIIEASEGIVGEYSIEFEERKYGQYFILENDNEKKWITISADYTISKEDGGSTNAYFVQFIPMALRALFEDNTYKNKKAELYLKGTSHSRATTDGQILYYRVARTIDINILNANELNRVGRNIQKEIEKKFKTVEEWQSERLKMQNRKTSNRSSYILEENDSYIFYGKTFGANGRESIFILYMLSKLVKKEGKKIYLYEVADNGTTAIESSMNDDDKRFKNMLESFGIIYYIDSVDYVENEAVGKLLDEKDKDARHQAEFMRNLLIKFNAERDENGEVKRNKNGSPIIVNTMKKCYLCECTIQKAIIASHVQRVTDINKLPIPFEEKRKKAVDGDNGFWLCANHDKMFEYGIITFDENTGLLQIDLESLDEKQKKYINEITQKMKVDEKHFTEKLKEYLEIHNNRIKQQNVKYNYEELYLYNENIESELKVAEEGEEYRYE